MPDRLELATFEPHVGDSFTVDGADGSSVALTLDAATAARWQPEGEEALAFELIFRGPSDPVLPQATYPLTHEGIGAIDVFIVPLSRDEDGTTYQAVFS